MSDLYADGFAEDAETWGSDILENAAEFRASVAASDLPDDEDDGDEDGEEEEDEEDEDGEDEEGADEDDEGGEGPLARTATGRPPCVARGRRTKTVCG